VQEIPWRLRCTFTGSQKRREGFLADRWATRWPMPLPRLEGNDATLRDMALRNAQALACGHTFVLLLQNAYAINLLNAIRNVPEVCSIFCATANPVEIIVAESEQGRGVLGVI
jgi:adenosine/AMP kinase